MAKIGSYFDVEKIENRVKILSKFNGRCAYCGFTLTLQNLQIDHIQPLLRTKYPQFNIGIIKGANTIDNYNPCCKSCNCSKSHYPLEVWRKKISQDYTIISNSFPRYRLLVLLGLLIETNNPVIFYFETLNNG